MRHLAYARHVRLVLSLSWAGFEPISMYVWTGFFAAETYALFDRPTVLLGITAALGLACPVISLVSMHLRWMCVP